MSLWDDVKKNVVELYSVTSDKTTEIAKVGSRRWDKFGISRDIERQFSELGNLVYTGLQEGRKDILEEPAVAVLVARVNALEVELKKKEEEISRIHDEHRTRKAAEAAGGSTSPDWEDPEAETWAPEGDDQDDAPEVLLKDPVLEAGRNESAILVEPGEDSNDQDVESDGSSDTKDV